MKLYKTRPILLFFMLEDGDLLVDASFEVGGVHFRFAAAWLNWLKCVGLSVMVREKSLHVGVEKQRDKATLSFPFIFLRGFLIRTTTLPRFLSCFGLKSHVLAKDLNMLRAIEKHGEWGWK